MFNYIMALIGGAVWTTLGKASRQSYDEAAMIQTLAYDDPVKAMNAMAEYNRQNLGNDNYLSQSTIQGITGAYSEYAAMVEEAVYEANRSRKLVGPRKHLQNYQATKEVEKVISDLHKQANVQENKLLYQEKYGTSLGEDYEYA